METAWIKARALEQRIDATFYGTQFVENQRRIEAAAPCVRLDDLRQAERPITNGIRGPEFADTDYRMLRLQDIDQLWFDSHTALRVSAAQFHNNRRAHCRPGDILLAIGGYIGVVGKIVDSAPQTMGQHSALLAFDATKLDGDYALAFFSSKSGTMLCQRHVSGGVQAGINLEDVREIRIPVPCSTIQSAIGNKVRKAERLRALAASSLATAKTLVGTFIASLSLTTTNHATSLTSWVRPKWLEHRIDPSYYDGEVMNLTQAIENAPRHATLGKLAPDMCNGPHGGIEYVTAAEGIRYLRAKNLEDLSVNDNDPVYIPRSTHELNLRAEVVPGDLVITITGANIGAVGVIPQSIPRANIIQSLGKLRIVTDDDPAYIAAFLGSSYGAMLISREAVNTAREGINFEYLARVPIPLPSKDLQTTVGNAVRGSTASRAEARLLLSEARAAVESLINGTLDEPALLAEGEAIEQWLAANPSPQDAEPV
ncbi:restriction endonuclease subunit S [Candidatus Thiodictyon syntrophicum]|jgi:type I restriction enzyme S subunit|uniref:Type I restriction modification DNA specificity domain-containing protein n=1 Tax=Candidatus Thiodictyon syntrophicum TaxID=1166950 RepID=A0A2K8UB43_9GAMM|nr:restriction endonuclease subunit S [Candidatus Thiodictyon syntrophicum]AUB82281.1 hypothetical protein THSYN_15880 [Candidatus Thiodictyon syntrophicum]